MLCPHAFLRFFASENFCLVYAWYTPLILSKAKCTYRLWIGFVSAECIFPDVLLTWWDDSDDRYYNPSCGIRNFHKSNKRLRVGYLGRYAHCKILMILSRFAVSTVMFTTSVLISIQMRQVKRLPVIVAIAFFIFYGFIDGRCRSLSRKRWLTLHPGLFWGASLRKVPHGAWVPLLLGCLL